MSYHVAIPKKIVYDTKMREVDLRLYTIIADQCNDLGYSEITNLKLIELSGKKERTVRESLTALSDGGYIVVLHHVKESKTYPKNLPRVIWLEEAHASHKSKAREIKQKTKENDFKLFVEWLKTDCVNIQFPVDIGGLVHRYFIAHDGFMYRIETGERPALMASGDSFEVFKKMFRKKSVIIKTLELNGQSNAMQQLAELANAKKVNDGAE